MRIRARGRRAPQRPAPRPRRDDAPTASAGRVVGGEVKAQVTRLVVEVGNRAQLWRDAALDAELAFHSWQTAPRGERDAAAAAYLAAIEREEKAAREYSRASQACCASLPEVGASIAARRGRNPRRWRLSYDDP
jgi:hypothetical protein